MAVVLTKLPQVKVKAKTSKWNAVHHPITFEFQRQDVKVLKAIPSVLDGTAIPCTNLYVTGSIPTDLKEGQNINYVVNNIKYTAKVLTIDYPNVIYVEKILNTPLNGGVIVLIESYNSYYVEVEIYGVDASNTYKSIGFTKCSSNEMGIVKVNVHEWLQTQAIYPNKFAYNVINKLQSGDGGKFNIIWREIFNGVTANIPFTSLNPNNVFYWSNSSKQIKDIYSANMGDFNPTIDTTRTDKAKFLSVFDKPTYFVGYPFSISFIYSDQLENTEITRREKTYNINGLQVANTTDLINMTERGFVNRLMLKQSYTSAVKSVNLWLETSAYATTKNPVQWREDYCQEVFRAFDTFTPITMPFIKTSYTYE